MRREDGFSLIELLVAMVIIGVLAAIALPVFIGQRDKANAADAKSQVAAARKAIESYGVEQDGYTGATTALLAREEESLGEVIADGRLVVSGTGSSAPGNRDYIVAVQAKSTGTYFAFHKDASGTKRFCAPVSAKGCGSAVPGVSFPGIGPVGSW